MSRQAAAQPRRYLADNGITIKACNDANIGDTGVVNGVTYTVVDEAMLSWTLKPPGTLWQTRWPPLLSTLPPP